MQGLTAFQRHKRLLREYESYYGEAAPVADALHAMKTDLDTLKEQYRFIRTEEDDGDGKPWEIALARKYYSRLFKEYAVVDLSRYKARHLPNAPLKQANSKILTSSVPQCQVWLQIGSCKNVTSLFSSFQDSYFLQEGKIGCRWRTHAEVVAGKGQFTCGATDCSKRESLETLEMPFKYMEAGKLKQALVKVRLCQEHSMQLNYTRNRDAFAQQKKRQRLAKEAATSTDLSETSRRKARLVGEEGSSEKIAHASHKGTVERGEERKKRPQTAEEIEAEVDSFLSSLLP